MPGMWKTVRIFISSTFRDMHAERDHLVRFVFPELRERCAKRRLHLVDVDLRWGVTEEDAERGKALEICLDEIERCRPFFIGILGERYGWVPPSYDLPEEPKYDWARKLKPVYSITALEIHDGVLADPDMAMRAFFYYRDPGFLSELPAEHRDDFLPEIDDAEQKLKELKAQIRERYPVFEYACSYGGIDKRGRVTLTGLDDFGQHVLEDLWTAIAHEYPDEEAQPDELTIERRYHEAFIENRARRFIGRRELLQRLTAHAEGSNNVPLVVVGTPGSGKSALLANFTRAYAEARPDVFVLSHFIGVSPGSSEIRRTLSRLCRELARHFAIEDEIPQDYEGLRKALPELIEKGCSRGKVLLVLDALDQLDDTQHARTLNWLPHTLPQGLRLIVSMLEGDCTDALRRRRPAPAELTVDPLSESACREIVRETLWDYRKRLDEQPENDQLGLLLGKRESGNPLYLAVACEELRVFGEFERLTDRIAGFADDVPRLFGQVLERLERDHGKGLVRSAFSLLACTRQGLLESEMLELLAGAGDTQFPRAIWARLYRTLQFYLRPAGETGEGTLYFFHQQLSQAVRQRYLVSNEKEIAEHTRLARYFHRKADPNLDSAWTGSYARGLAELPYHLTHAQLWDDLYATLTDFRFLERKAADVGVVESTGVKGTTTKVHTGIFLLQGDFELALAKMPSEVGEAPTRARTRHPSIVAAFEFGGQRVVRCPTCAEILPLQETNMGKEITCPREGCSGWMRINPFPAPWSHWNSL